MGILDDAIRQHLELKRRHGADPSDVAKLEQEAFGPIERGEALEVPPPVTDDPAAHDVAQEEERAFAEEEHEAGEQWAAEPAAVLPPPPVAPPPPDERPRAPLEPLPAPVPPAEPLRPGGSIPLDDVGERTVEFSALDAPDPQPDGEHDELEETPDFLEETPEHDRLWFEQKPPRDFDF